MIYKISLTVLKADIANIFLNLRKTVFFILLSSLLSACLDNDKGFKSNPSQNRTDVTPGDILPGVLSPSVLIGSLSQLPAPLDGSCELNQIMQWNGMNWVCIDTPSVTGAPATSVPASGVTAGTLSVDVLLPVDQISGRINPSTQIANGELSQGVTLANFSQLPVPFNGSSCQSGHILQWSGSVWNCVAQSVGGTGTVTRVESGSGLTGGPIINNGTISIQNAGVTAVHLASGSVGSDEIINLSVSGEDIANNTVGVTKLLNEACTDGKVLKASGANFICADDNTSGNGSSLWTDSAGNIYRATGSVGVGTMSPDASLHISDQDTTKPALFLEGASSTEGDIAWADGESLQMGVWDKTLDVFDLHMTVTDNGTVQIENEVEFVGSAASSGNGMIQKNQSLDRDEMQIYSTGDAYGTNSSGAGIHLYGNNDDEHSGNIAFLTGNNNEGNGRMIIAGGGGGASVGDRDLASTHVTIGNGVFDFVDTRQDTALLNIKDPSGHPAINIMGASSSEGDLAIPTGEAFSLGHWSSSTSTFTPRFQIDSAGEVGIGVTSPSTALHVLGDVTIEGSNGTCVIDGSGACSSDERLKEKVARIDESVFEKLHQIDGWLYTWNDTTIWNQNQLHMGVLAQEVKRAFPQIVVEKDIYVVVDGERVKEKRYMVKYDRLVVPLLEAYKSLDNRAIETEKTNFDQNRKIEMLELENSKLRKRLLALEKLVLKLVSKETKE